MTIFRLTLENVEVTTETLYEVLAGASAGGTSINHVCETTEDSPHANTVRGHLTDQFDLETVEAVGNTLLQRDVLETLPDRPVEIVADLHLDPYYGEDRDRGVVLLAGETRYHCVPCLRHAVCAGAQQAIHAGGSPAGRWRNHQRCPR